MEINDKCKLLMFYITTFEEIPNNNDYIIFTNNNIEEIKTFISNKIYDLIRETYQDKILRQPTQQEYKNQFTLFKNSKINKKSFIKSIISSNEYIKLHTNIKPFNDYPKIKYSYVNLNDYVDAVYLINLERRTDKLDKTTSKLNKLNIKFERFNGIDGSNVKIRDEWIQYLEKGSKISSPGAYGCLISHLEIIKKAKQNLYKNILIFEDDIVFHRNFNDELRKINSIPEDYAIIYLGGSQLRNNGIQFSVNKNYYQANQTYGTFAYIINSKIYDILIDVLSKRQYDIDISLCIIQKQHNCYVLYENIIIADLSISDIRTDQHSYDAFGWDISKYNFENTESTTITKKHIGHIKVDNIDDAIFDMNNTKNMNLIPGYSFLIRAKNEELLVEYCLESIVDIADEIIFVDNGSNDSTFDTAQNLGKKYGNIFVYQYNIDVPRAGSMHEKAVENGSLNTLATYYNWCLSKATRYNIIKWDCDFIAIKENLIKMIDKYDLKTRDDKFGIWFTGKTLFYGKFIREQDYYDEFRVYSKKNKFKWDNYKGCETAAYYNWSLDTAYINGSTEIFSDIRYKNLEKYKKISPPLFYEIKTKNDIKPSNNILDSRDSKDNELLLKLELSKNEMLKSIETINNKKYRILITIPGLSLGGGNLWTVNMYRALIELGFDVKIYCNFISKDNSENTYIDSFDQQDILHNVSRDAVLNYIIDNEIKYIIQTTPLFSTESDLKKLRDNNVYITVLTHSDVSYINNYIHTYAPLFNKIITVNHKTIDKLAKYGINHTSFIPNYINIEQVQEDKKLVEKITKKIVKKFGIISRLSTDKNIIMTLFAFKKFIKRYIDYELHIVGDDTESTMLGIKYYVKKLNLDNRVILHGYKKNVLDYYNMFDCIILPSVSEGCPYNLLEAALTLTPIICSDVGGNKELVGNHSVTFQLKEAETYSQNVLYVNTYDDHLEKIGYKIVSRHDDINIPKDTANFLVIPSIDCTTNGTDKKLSNMKKAWNKNVQNISDAFVEFVSNSDHYINESNKLHIDIVNRYSSKHIFINSLIETLDLDIKMTY